MFYWRIIWLQKGTHIISVRPYGFSHTEHTPQTSAQVGGWGLMLVTFSWWKRKALYPEWFMLSQQISLLMLSLAYSKSPQISVCLADSTGFHWSACLSLQ